MSIHLPAIYRHCPTSSIGCSGMQGIYTQLTGETISLIYIYIYICSVAVCKACMIDWLGRTYLSSKHIKRRIQLPWFNDKITQEIQLRHKKERAWTKDPTEYNLQAFYYQRRYAANIIKSAQREYYINEIRENRNNFKAVFKITNKLLFRNKQLPLPPTPLIRDLANEFNEFFIDKINKIMVKLKQEEPDKRHIESAPLTSVNVSSFTPTTIPEMAKLIHKTTIKSCELDPLPARLLKVNIKLIAPAITDIVKHLLDNGKSHHQLKTGCPTATPKEIKPRTGTEKLQTGLKFILYFQDVGTYGMWTARRPCI